MPYILAIIGFVFYRVIFKMGYNVNLPIFPNILICLGLFFAGFMLNRFMMVRFGSLVSAKRFGISKPALATPPLFLVLIAICAMFSAYAFIISFGFTDRFHQRTWSRADDWFELGEIILIFLAPFLLHFVVNQWALSVKLKNIDTL